MNNNNIVIDKDDLYNVNNYTEDELFKILDISNPTDRELEARILSQINKFKDMKNDFGEKMFLFLNNIYSFFFDENGMEDGEEVENATTMMEGFTLNQETDSSNNLQDTPIEKGIITTTIPSSKVSFTKNLEYSKGSLNPILKETIKRIICVDSQFRNIITNPYSTDFTFNLSETLQDVVSLKLYSIHIPFTWYTINKNFGANFFYLKGNSPGINNGNFDYKIQISSGTYTAPLLIDALNSSLQTLISSNKDVDFGTTSFFYDVNKINAKFTFYLQNVFNETYYKLVFPYWTDPTDSLKITQTKSIPGFFGYNNTTYYPYEFFSDVFSLDPFSIQLPDLIYPKTKQ